VKLKEFIRKLKDFDEELLVTFLEDFNSGGVVCSKEHSDLFRGSLNVETTPIGCYVRHKKDEKGKYLFIDLVNSSFFTQDDFKESK
jgi:hypothetical protein